MADHANIEYSQLGMVVCLYEDRAQRAWAELGPVIAEGMHAEVLEVFETQGYGEWPPFAPSTLQARSFKPRARNKDGSLKRTKKGKLVKRRRIKGTPKLLQDTGLLVGSLTPVWNASEVEVYTNVRYAKFHITGTRHMPQRNFLSIDLDAYESDVASMIVDYITRPQAA